MIPRPRTPRVQRSTLVLIIAVAALAFPLGALAVHQFDDVPTGASYHDDVEALVAHGITSGCAPDLYCPGNAVTRAQMAQFLNRLGDLDGNSTPSVNADRVDDFDANELIRIDVAGASSGDVAVTGSSAAPQTVANGTATIVAPAAGIVQVTAVLTYSNYSTACTGLTCNAFLQVRHVQAGALGPYSTTAVSPTESAVEVGSVTWAFAVSAGTNDFRMEVFKNAGGVAGIAYFNPQITAIYSPFGSTGTSTLSLDSVPVTEPQPGQQGRQ